MSGTDALLELIDGAETLDLRTSCPFRSRIYFESGKVEYSFQWTGATSRWVSKQAKKALKRLGVRTEPEAVKDTVTGCCEAETPDYRAVEKWYSFFRHYGVRHTLGVGRGNGLKKYVLKTP